MSNTRKEKIIKEGVQKVNKRLILINGLSDNISLLLNVEDISSIEKMTYKTLIHLHGGPGMYSCEDYESIKNKVENAIRDNSNRIWLPNQKQLDMVALVNESNFKEVR